MTEVDVKLKYKTYICSIKRSFFFFPFAYQLKKLNIAGCNGFFHNQGASVGLEDSELGQTKEEDLVNGSPFLIFVILEKHSHELSMKMSIHQKLEEKSLWDWHQVPLGSVNCTLLVS